MPHRGLASHATLAAPRCRCGCHPARDGGWRRWHPSWLSPRRHRHHWLAYRIRPARGNRSAHLTAVAAYSCRITHGHYQACRCPCGQARAMRRLNLSPSTIVALLHRRHLNHKETPPRALIRSKPSPSTSKTMGESRVHIPSKQSQPAEQ